MEDHNTKDNKKEIKEEYNALLYIFKGFSVETK
jgi:hypothetical protein